MALKNALLLIDAIGTDSTLRGNIYKCSDSLELNAFLDSNGYIFNSSEFEDAVNYLHTKCQTNENAQDLMEKAELLRFMFFINDFVL